MPNQYVAPTTPLCLSQPLVVATGGGGKEHSIELFTFHQIRLRCLTGKECSWICSEWDPMVNLGLSEW